ncbi:MAG: hypothetical protein ACR2FZ_09045 [Thermoleophilaceae bacterium]|jgi:hypothetical protein
MRTLLKVQMETEAANEAISQGQMPGIMQQTTERLQPEAAYFSPADGVRTAYFVFDLKDPSDIPVISEPLFQTLRARLTFTPVMNQEDLQKGLSQIG